MGRSAMSTRTRGASPPGPPLIFIFTPPYKAFADALCIVTLTVCCVIGTDNDTVTDIDIDTDTVSDTYTATVDNDTDAAHKLYFGIILKSHIIHIML